MDDARFRVPLIKLIILIPLFWLIVVVILVPVPPLECFAKY